MFFENFGAPIAQLDLMQRKVISIDYPGLTIEDEELWFTKEWFEKVKQKFAEN
ncbi:MAG: hypothetical protein NVV73_01295 [Cellvibrionaceae bacterium]|nr:hypothetical protein [Cellvibrionaceae bacterium]